MNEIVNKFLLAEDKFMPEIHLRQPRFTYSVCGPFTENKQRIQKFKETGDTIYIYKNELGKACFQHDMAYGDFKDLKRRTFSDNVLRDKAFNIAKNPKYDGYQRGLASVVCKCFDKKPKGSGVANNEIKEKFQLPEELHKPIIRNFEKRTVYSGFKDNIWGLDLADMKSLSKYNKGFKYLLRTIDLFSKYTWVIPIKDKKSVSIVDAFQKIWDDSNRKPNKIWVEKGSEFHNNSRDHRTIKMKPIDVKDNIYVDSKKEVNDKDPKFKIGDHVRISKYKKIFAKEHTPNWSEEVFLITKIKNTVPWTYVINDLNNEGIIGTFYEKELQKTNQKEFRTEKVIKRMGDKLYVKWKGYNSSFNSWINKKDLA